MAKGTDWGNLKRTTRRVRKLLEAELGEKMHYTSVLSGVRENHVAARVIALRDERLLSVVLFEMLLPEFREGETQEWQD